MLHPFLAVNIRFSWCFDLIFAYFCRFSYFSCTILAVSVCSKTHCFPLCLGLPTRPRHRPGLQCPGCEWLRHFKMMFSTILEAKSGVIFCNHLQFCHSFYIWTWIWLYKHDCTILYHNFGLEFEMILLFGICCCDPRISPEPFNCHPCRSHLIRIVAFRHQPGRVGSQWSFQVPSGVLGSVAPKSPK